MTRKLILVTGATGRQGKALINALSLNPPAREGSSAESSDSENFHFLALTRKASSPSANFLASQSRVTVVEGNMDSIPSIRKIFEDAKSQGGIWGVFCVLAFPGLGANADGEEAQGMLVADLALEFGVTSFVFSSVERGGERDDDKAVLDRLAKVKIEQHIRELGNKGLPWTILRPGFFMENYEGTIGSITVSVLKAGLQPTTTIQLIAVDDIGYVAAGVFTDPKSFHHQILSVIGERCTMKEQEESYKRATGRSIPAVPSFIARMLISINGHTKGLIADIERVHQIQEEGAAPNHDAQIAAARKAYPALRNFETWAQGKRVSDRQKGWNNVSIGKLATGKQ
ncbi:NAD(P)-binding protein [Gymnopus androsaceus JB14]|uniref:NAD(P)-binding protein n=1 Tax=Gymnopus androsaceus JB14 TaxID=1447944 RepID=A0A6A4IFM6_9AGAR|nr:NAD(P)-binding protein [Gymnopus androsaceus JB14]